MRAWSEIEPLTPGTSAPPAWIGVAVAGVVVAVLMATGHVVPALLLVVVVAAMTVARRVDPRADAAIGRFMAAVGRLAFVGLSLVLLAIVGFVVFVPVWLAAKLLGWDPLAAFGDSRAGQWQGRRRARRKAPLQALPDRPFADDRRPRAGRRRAHAALIALVPVVAVVAVAVAMQDRLTDLALDLLPERDAPQARVPVRVDIDERTEPGDIGDVPNWFGGNGPRANNNPTVARLPEEDWYGQFDVDGANLRYQLDPYLTIRHPDYTSTYINITDRVRRSWLPPDGDSPEALEVWFFGGSALFGAEQRDEFTIPSQVARLAAEEGHLLRVQNFGMPSFVSWQDQLLMVQMLAERPAPDLILFYDGYNDFGLYSGTGAPTEQSTLFADDIRQALIDRGAQLVGGADVDPTPRTAAPSPANAATLFNRSVRAARATARAAEVPIIHFFQPSLWSRSEAADDATLASIEIDRATHQRFSASLDEMRASLDDEVADVADALDGLDEVVYADEVHHNEAAAATIGAALYRAIQPTIQVLDAHRSS